MANDDGWWDNYNSYLESPQWDERREFMLDLANHSCEYCGVEGRIFGRHGAVLHVHHVSYARLGHELILDLIVLCKACHNSAHSDAEFKQKIKLLARLSGDSGCVQRWGMYDCDIMQLASSFDSIPRWEPYKPLTPLIASAARYNPGNGPKDASRPYRGERPHRSSGSDPRGGIRLTAADFPGYKGDRTDRFLQSEEEALQDLDEYANRLTKEYQGDLADRFLRAEEDVAQ